MLINLKLFNNSFLFIPIILFKHTHTPTSLFWGIFSINCICLTGMSVWSRSFSLSVGFPLLSVMYIYIFLLFFLCQQPVSVTVQIQLSVLIFLHIVPVQEVSPVANIPKFLSTYTVFLPLQAWNLLEMESVFLYHG